MKHSRRHYLADLSKDIKFYSAPMADQLVDRIRVLTEAGETPRSILARMNGPARSETWLGEFARPGGQDEGLSKSDRAIYAPRPRALPDLSISMKVLKCDACDQDFTTPVSRGRYPRRCRLCATNTKASA